MNGGLTAQVGVVVTLQTCIREVPFSNLCHDTSYPNMAVEGFRSPYRQIPGYCLELEHDRSHSDIMFSFEKKNLIFLLPQNLNL